MSAGGYLEKADQAVRAAKKLLMDEQFEAAANRAYYAMFHAARAALLTVGDESAKKHARVIGQFGLRFVREGRLPLELGRAINDAQQLRIESDYGPGSPDPEAVRSSVAKAEEFVAADRGIIPADQLRP